MKLIIAIVANEDAADTVTALVESKFYVTKLATTGGFLKAGNTTLIVGTEIENVEKALKIIEDNCKKRQHEVPIMETSMVGIHNTQTVRVPIGGATVFVVDVEQFMKI